MTETVVCISADCVDGFQESSICENISVRGGAAGYVLSRQLCKNINENIVETEVRFVHAVTAGSSVRFLPVV